MHTHKITRTKNLSYRSRRKPLKENAVKQKRPHDESKRKSRDRSVKSKSNRNVKRRNEWSVKRARELLEVGYEAYEEPGLQLEASVVLLLLGQVYPLVESISHRYSNQCIRHELRSLSWCAKTPTICLCTSKWLWHSSFVLSAHVVFDRNLDLTFEFYFNQNSK